VERIGPDGRLAWNTRIVDRSGRRRAVRDVKKDWRVLGKRVPWSAISSDAR
jgi:hypothetical protein